LFFSAYGRFLSTSMVAAKPIAIARIIAIEATKMYVSVAGNIISGFGDAVGAALDIVMYVVAEEGP